MWKIETFLAAALFAGTLTSCAIPVDSLVPAVGMRAAVLPASSTPLASGHASVDGLDPVGPGEITPDEEAAAAAVANRFPGARIASLGPEEIVRAGRLSCVLADQDNPDLYNPAVLKGSMRQAYIWSGKEQDARVVPALVEHFCPDLYPGDAMIDKLMDQITR